MGILSDKKYLIDAFQKNFGQYIGKPIVVYGIGQGTQYILDNFPNHTFVGLMDKTQTGDTIYGLPILSFGGVVALGVKLIVIVARSVNIKLIYGRIAGPAKEHSIEVFDINGNKLEEEINSEKFFAKYQKINEPALRDQIECADSVSFDIFDTLIMRRCLYPQDVFLLMGEDFARRRVQAETELYAEGRHPNIYDIYKRLGNGLSPQAEIELETELITARKSMADMLRYAAGIGKKVFLTSDMYLPKEIIARILEGLDIHVDLGNILVSCDYGAAKANGLFEMLRLKAGGGRILHIGDNFEVDTVAARQYGLEPFPIERAVVMLADCYGANLLQYDNTLANRLMIGEFIARRLNDPFLFARTRGKFEIDSHYEMAHSFIAPMVIKIFSYVAEMAKTLGLDMVLLPSRDGYILERLYSLFKDELDLPSMRYLYISRNTSAVIGLLDEGDIIQIIRHFYSGTPEDMLQDRFRLPADALMPRGEAESDEAYVLKHKEAILRVAAVERQKYLRYLNTLGIPAGARVGFFDFIASGTCQKALANIVDFYLTGLYVARLDYAMDYKSDTRVEAMCGVVTLYERNFNIIDNYFFMENVLTSYDATLSGIDDAGEPLFLPEHRTEADFAALHEIHQAIVDYAQKTRRKDWATIDLALADRIFGYIADQYTKLNTGYFSNGELRDEFRRLTFPLEVL